MHAIDTLQQTEYYSNSTIGEQQTDHMALEHCYREYCTERNDNYYFTVLPKYGFAHVKVSEFNLLFFRVNCLRIGADIFILQQLERIAVR